MFKFNRKNLILVLIERFSVVLRHANRCLKKFDLNYSVLAIFSHQFN